MAKAQSNTEEKIKDAARKLFVEKGFGNATTRDIAECADTNIALVNYYFRSKENLFQEVFQESFAHTFLPVARILNDDLPLEVKIYKFVDHMTEMLKRDPMMPLFVLSEMRGEHSQMCRIMLESGALESNSFQEQLNREAAKGAIRAADALQVETSLMSMVLFPFLSMNILKMKHQMDDEAFTRFVDSRKKIIPEMTLAYLRQREG
ncbi:MAG: TetR/AcrR family transcriptional regulator [Saprospirales bacterium]|jgi:TetR/AcrR family transcriptional regulator|nr:TetR/AcrR family transcriptional regulator [Saprospirales bacterium]MBK8922773.1 TetR/AcrR family transcriptional regulator [Saprospirales bacterium]